MHLDQIQLTGPIVMKDEAQRIAYAAPLVVGEADSDNDTVTKEKCEEVAHGWLEDFRGMDHQHDLSEGAASPVESYLTPADMTVKMDGEDATIPAGSWIVASRIAEKHWPRVMSGEIAGYSIMGVGKKEYERAMLDAAAKSTEGDVAFEVSLKRTTLADLGEDWVCPLVSIVDKPAVPKAKFFALKAAGETQEERPSWWTRLFGSSSEATSEKEADVTPEQVAQIVEEILKKKGLLKKPTGEGGDKPAGDGGKVPPQFMQKSIEDLDESERTQLVEHLMGPALKELGLVEEDEDGVTKSKASELEEQLAAATERIKELEGTSQRAVTELQEEMQRRLAKIVGKSKRLPEEDGEASRFANKSEDEHWSDGYAEMGLDSFGRPLSKAAS